MITENVFEARFMFAQELARLGADLRTDGHHAVVRGVPMLSGAPVVAHDIRAGAALVLAGLAAQGTTEVAESQHIDRGYPWFAEALAAVGAEVTIRLALTDFRAESPYRRVFARTDSARHDTECGVRRVDIGYGNSGGAPMEHTSDGPERHAGALGLARRALHRRAPRRSVYAPARRARR